MKQGRCLHSYGRAVVCQQTQFLVKIGLQYAEPSSCKVVCVAAGHFDCLFASTMHHALHAVWESMIIVRWPCFAQHLLQACIVIIPCIDVLLTTRCLAAQSTVIASTARTAGIASSLRETEPSSYRIKYGTAETAWYSTASCGPGPVCVRHTARRRYITNRLSCRICHCCVPESKASCTISVHCSAQKHCSTGSETTWREIISDQIKLSSFFLSWGTGKIA